MNNTCTGGEILCTIALFISIFRTDSPSIIMNQSFEDGLGIILNEKDRILITEPCPFIYSEIHLTPYPSAPQRVPLSSAFQRAPF